MDEGTDAIDMLEGRIVPLRQGYVGVVSRNAKDTTNYSKTIKESLAEEALFFRQHPSYRNISHRCGVPYLSKLLNRRLMYHIRDTIPDLKTRLMRSIHETEAELQSYGDPLFEKDGSSQGALLLHLFSKFTRNFCDSIDGKRLKNGDQLAGGARLHHIFHEIFARTIQDFDCFYVKRTGTNRPARLSDAEIRTAIRNATGPKAVLFVPEAAFELLVKKQIEKLEEPCLQCIDHVFEELQRIVVECEVPEMRRFVNLRDSIFEVVRGVLKKCLQPTNQMIINLIQIELAAGPLEIILGLDVRPHLVPLEELRQGAGAAAGAYGHLPPGSPGIEAHQSREQSRQSPAMQQPEQQSASSSFFSFLKGSVPLQSQPGQGTLLHQSGPAGNKLRASFTDSGAAPGSHQLSGAAGGHGTPHHLVPASLFPPSAVGGGAASASGAGGVIASTHSSGDRSMLNPNGAYARIQQPHEAAAIRLPQMPSTVFPSDELSDRERVEINIIKTLIASYYGIVKKNIVDAVPKSVMQQHHGNTDAIVILLTLPFYACVFFRDNYIDEGFAVTRNADVADVSRSTWYDVLNATENGFFTPLMLVHDFWGQDLWPNDGIHWTHKSYRPLITYSFRLSYLLFPHDPMPSLRFLNCLTHTLCCLVLKRCWFFRENVFAAYLFAVHPVHVENIVYLVGRADSAATLFFLLGADSENLLRVAACTVASGLCKETGFTLPILVAFLCLVQRKYVKGALFLVLFLAVFAARSAFVQGTTAEFGYVDTPKHLDLRVMGILAAYLFLVAMFFRVVPRRRKVLDQGRARANSGDHGEQEMVREADADDDDDGAPVGCRSGSRTKSSSSSGVAISSQTIKRNDAMLIDYFAAAMVVIPFVPASNLFFLVGTTIGERLLYPCTVGSCLLVTRVFLSPENLFPWLRRYARMTHWRSKETLFEVDAKASKWQPRSAKILHQYAVLLQAKGESHHDEALSYYQKALDVFDDNAMSDYCMARIYLEKGDCHKGLQIFIKINNGTFLLNNDFGYALSCVGAYDEAVPILEEALTILPTNFAYVYNALALGVFHLRKDLQKVIDLLQTGLSMHPDEFTLWFNMGVVLLKGQVFEEAQKTFVEAEKHVKTIFEYQTLVDAVGKMKEGKQEELQLLWLKVPVARS
eukprot:g10662.t1